jgi:hypothetical protein
MAAAQRSTTECREAASWRSRAFNGHLSFGIRGERMKLTLFFIVMDTLILLAYPFLFIASKLREILKNKR